MHVLRSIVELSAVRGPVVLAIGVFDGMHLGHQAVLREAMTSAGAVGGTAVAVTFDPHPVKILRPDHAPRLLTSTPHKLRLMEEFGLGEVLLLTFDQAFAAREADAFVTDLARAGNPLARICVGEGWRFGHGRLGDGALLRQMGGRLGFETSEVAPVMAGGRVVSSTSIREAAERGDLGAARDLLGRRYSVLGTVVKGEGLGRKLGFPTANLAAHNEQFPPDGVYAVRVRFGAQMVDGVANIGTRPTVSSTGQRLLEVHLIDGGGDLYGSDLEVFFEAFLRGEQKFSGVEALRGQILSDVGEAKRVLAG